MAFIDKIKEKARSDKKKIVLPESMDVRTYEAAQEILKEGIADIVIIGTQPQINENNKGFDISKAEIINPFESDKLESYINELYELRKNKGMSPDEAKRLLTTDYMYFACMMLKNNEADGIVSGACHSTANTILPCLQIIKTKPGTKIVSAFFIMELPDKSLGEDGLFVYGDCGLNQNPNPDELAEIAASSAESFKKLVGAEPYVAMLSYSTKGSAKHPDVEKVVNATNIVKEKYKDLKVDGELQLDAAVIPEIGASKAPGSGVAGKANVLIFPDLDAGNIGYKLTERMAKANAYGPLLQGIAKPANDLSRGCSAKDIVGVAAITAVQAQG